MGKCDPKNCKATIVEMLISKGADVNCQDHTGHAPINFASQHGLQSIVKLLISHGANVNNASSIKRTPLHEAADRGHSSVVELLIAHGADVHTKVDFNYKSYKNAECHCEFFYGVTPIHLAAWGHLEYEGHPDVVDILLSHGADVNALTKEGLTPLHLAASTGCIETAKRLLDKGANVNAVEGICEKAYTVARKRTPLHRACLRGHTAMVELLIKSGAHPEIKDTKNQMPLELTPSSCTNIHHLITSHFKSQLQPNKRNTIEVESESSAKKKRH